MALILWLKNSKLTQLVVAIIGAIVVGKLIELFGAKRGRAEAKAERNEQRINDVHNAKQDYQDAENQTDDDLTDRLTRD